MLNFDMFLETLPIMGMGMLGIFIVTGAIIVVTILLNKLTQDKK